MRAVSASIMCFSLTLAGVALLILIFFPRKRILVRILAAIVTLVAVLTLTEHLTGIDFGIDTLVYDDVPGSLATAAPGRMGIPASTSLMAVGLGLIFATLGESFRRWSSVLGTAAIAIRIPPRFHPSSRSLKRWIFPPAVFGRSVANSIQCGHL